MPTGNRKITADDAQASNGRAPITRRGMLKAGGAGLGSLAVFGGFTGPGAALNSINTPRLSTEGNWLVDPKGKEVVLRGVNVEDPFWAEHFDDKTIATKMREAVSGDWYSRVVRLPCEVQRIVEAGGVEMYVKNYVDPLVDLAEELGVYLIIDWHEVADWINPAVQENLKLFWEFVAPRYADREHVIYEMFNEPIRPSENSLDNWKLWRDTAQPWVDMIRSHAPETPIIIGAPRYTQLTKYADDAPFEGDNLIYAAHLYPPHFEWQVDIDAIAETASNVPVALTEWGYMNDDAGSEHMQGTTSGYGEGMREWLTDNPSISWTPWCYSKQYAPYMWSNGAKDKWDESWNLLGGEDYMGELIRDFLYDARHDHRPGSSSGT